MPEKAVLQEMGAVFEGGICTRCHTIVVGDFICNIWDDSQTVETEKSIHLKGLNPLLVERGYKFIPDVEALEEIAEMRKAKAKTKTS